MNIWLLKEHFCYDKIGVSMKSIKIKPKVGTCFSRMYVYDGIKLTVTYAVFKRTGENCRSLEWVSLGSWPYKVLLN